jgi:hypothetical protein
MTRENETGAEPEEDWETFVTKGTLKRQEHAQRRANQDDLFLQRRKEVQNDELLTIAWQHPQGIGKMSDGYVERTSKALDPESELAKTLERARDRIVVYCNNVGFTIKKMWPLQVELLTRREDGNMTTLQRRASLMSGLSVHPGNLAIQGRSLVINLEPPVIENYKGLRITLCSFDSNADLNVLASDMHDLVIDSLITRWTPSR